jgi:hypothetical protein
MVNSAAHRYHCLGKAIYPRNHVGINCGMDSLTSCRPIVLEIAVTYSADAVQHRYIHASKRLQSSTAFTSVSTAAWIIPFRASTVSPVIAASSPANACVPHRHGYLLTRLTTPNVNFIGQLCLPPYFRHRGIFLPSSYAPYSLFISSSGAPTVTTCAPHTKSAIDYKVIVQKHGLLKKSALHSSEEGYMWYSLVSRVLGT